MHNSPLCYLRELSHLLCFVADETDDTHRIVTTVFELAGEDQSGLLADVTHLLTTNGCDVRSAAVSTSGLTNLWPDHSVLSMAPHPLQKLSGTSSGNTATVVTKVSS